MIKVAPSILSADFSKLGNEIQSVEKEGADIIHVDVMDGHFVPNITIGSLIVKSIKPVTNLPIDVHLMIENPDHYIKDFVESGADIITVHAEAVQHLHRTVHLIKSLGAKASVALNPATPLQVLDYILPDLDMVLLMTVNPGFGGQTFIDSVVKKIKLLKGEADKQGLDLDIEVDGGINAETSKLVTDAGANILVAGSYVFGNEDRGQAIRNLK